MKPILFTVPWLDMPVYGYGVMLGLAFVTGWFIIISTGRWYGLKEETYLGALLLAAVFSLIGARFFHVITNPSEHWTLMRILNFREGGLVAYGGYIFGVGAGVLYFRYKRAPTWLYLDAAAPTLALGLMFARLGCFLRGCCYGARTDSFLGLSFPPDSLVVQQHSERGWTLLANGWSVPVIPTQLIESTAGLTLVTITALILRRLKKARLAVESGIHPADAPGTWLRDGYVFLSFVTLYSMFRFCIEFVRDDGGRGSLGALSTSQIIGLLLIVGMVAWMWRRRHSSLIMAHETDQNPTAVRSTKRRRNKSLNQRKRR
jgi:phosphatidylglycerol:prolipoprotein diacylglycerol transferase